MPAFPRSTAFRAFSALSKTRAALKSMEPHPFARPVAQLEPAKGDWSKHIKSAAKTTALYVSLPAFSSFHLLENVS